MIGTILNKTLSITCIDAYTYEPTIQALLKTEETLHHAGIRVSKVYWFSDIPMPENAAQRLQFLNIDVQWTKIKRFKRYTDEYNFITLKLVPHIAVEDFNLIIHADGFAINADAWTDEFLNYDYIGARWPNGGVGNGGFCLRSRKLYDAMLSMDIGYESINYDLGDSRYYVIDGKGDKVVPEDNIICKIYRDELQEVYDIKFATNEIADRFSIEHNMGSPWLGKSLGFHGKHGVAKHYGVDL